MGKKQHKCSRTPTYGSWSAMRARCLRRKNKDWPRWGGKGIIICQRWDDFRNFLADMGERPDGMSLDRIDPSLGYFPENCRWATPKQQVRNSKSCLKISHQGETKLLVEWAEDLGVHPQVLKERLKRGESGARLLRKQDWKPLNEDEKKRIRHLAKKGLSVRAIAKQIGRARGGVSRVLSAV